MKKKTDLENLADQLAAIEDTATSDAQKNLNGTFARLILAMRGELDALKTKPAKKK